MRKRCRSFISDFVLHHSFGRRHSTFVICLVVVLAGIGTGFAEKRAITEKDLFDFVWIGDPQISPDGTRVAFVRVTVNEKKEGYNTSIWSGPVAGGEEPHQLTKSDHDGAPRWSPDGKFLLFVRATEKDGKPESPQLSILRFAPLASSFRRHSSFVIRPCAWGRGGNRRLCGETQNYRKRFVRFCLDRGSANFSGWDACCFCTRYSQREERRL